MPKLGITNNGTAHNEISDLGTDFVCTSKDNTTHAPIHHVYPSLHPQPMLHHEKAPHQEWSLLVGNKNIEQVCLCVIFSFPHFHN